MALLHSEFHFTGQQSVYHGKVRDVYRLSSGLLVMVASDRISAFDVVLPQGIPHKGQVLNQMAEHFLKATEDLVPNWRLASPDPVVSVGYAALPFKVEMVVRGYLSGHAWRTYASGGRVLCGVSLPEGLKESDRLQTPIITPTTKEALARTTKTSAAKKFWLKESLARSTTLSLRLLLMPSTSADIKWPLSADFFW